jgi:hypothetical protein
MIVNWDFYVRRKRLNVKAWLERKNIKDYKQLIEVTTKLGIETPSEEKVSEYFKKPEVKKNDKKIKKPVYKHTPKPDPKPDIILAELPEKIETDFIYGTSDEKLDEELVIKEEQPKQTRKRKPRKKRKPVKKEDQ